MKLPSLIIMCIACLESHAQGPLIPGSGSFEQKWVKPAAYQMKLYSISNDSRTELGTLTTKILVGDAYLIVAVRADIKNMSTAWMDSSFAELKTLRPVKHSSHNIQRDMVLNFGKVVTGIYNNKLKKTSFPIHDTTAGNYFDSNIYPVLLGWLPLANGYTRDISIYDFNPDANSGILNASIKQVSTASYQTEKNGLRSVWVLKVSDEIANGKNGIITYYFDKTDRRLWKQEMNANGYKLMLKLVE